MSWGRGARAALIFLLLVVLHYGLRPLLGWRTPVDFLVIGVLLASVRTRPGAAALLGLVTGLLAGSFVPSALGAAALAMTLVAAAASWLKAVFFADNVVLHAFFFFLGKWIFDAIFLFAGGAVGGGLSTQLFLWSPLSAAVTAVAGVLILLVLRPVLEPQNA